MCFALCTYLRSIKYSGVQPSTYVRIPSRTTMLPMVLLPTTTTCSMYVCAVLLRYSYVVYVRECYGTCIYSTNGIATVRRYLYVLYLRYACTYCYAHTYILTHSYLHIATLPIGIRSTFFHILYARYCYGTYVLLCTLPMYTTATVRSYVRMYFNVCILCMYST